MGLANELGQQYTDIDRRKIESEHSLTRATVESG
jgi:hypothetical protein